jgi:hypothetical protein
VIPLLLVPLLGCSDGDPPPAPPDDTSSSTETEPVEARFSLHPAPRLLRRISLDLLGVLPEASDLDRVEADPSQLSAVRDEMLQDPRLEDRLVQMFADRFLTRVDSFPLSHRDYNLDDELEHAFEVAVGEEPLRLMAHVAAHDLPWTEIVTADYALANGLLRQVWPMTSDEDTQDWAVSEWTDGRPAVGILASNGLWWRYPTTPFNYNRSRAAAVSRLLLCEDYLERPVVLTSSPTLADEDGTEQAVREDPACLACHVTMDPLAAAFFGFWWFDIYDTQELTYYHPEREPYNEVFLGMKASWFGQPISGLAELGLAVAADPRFHRCAAETAAEMLWRRPLDSLDFDRVEQFRLAYLDSGMQFKALLAAVTDSEEYQALAPIQGDDDLGAIMTRLITPSQLTSALQDLTGFTWTTLGFEQLGNDDLGYRTMAGGVDGKTVTSPQLDPSVSQVLVARRYAEAAASFAVTNELVMDTSDVLLPGVDLDSRPGDGPFDDALGDLSWRLFAERPSAQEQSELQDLWSEIEAIEGAEVAWTALLSVFFRDPRMQST